MGIDRREILFCNDLRSTGRGAVRLARLLWEQEVAGSNPVAPNLQVAVSQRFMARHRLVSGFQKSAGGPPSNKSQRSIVPRTVALRQRCLNQLGGLEIETLWTSNSAELPRTNGPRV